MGKLNHHTIVVTGWDAEIVKEARHQAFLIFEDSFAKSITTHGGELVSEIHCGCNGHASFFIAPDGSKEGWPDSDYGNVARSNFIGWLRHQRDCDFVFVEFGGDDDFDRIIDSGSTMNSL